MLEYLNFCLICTIFALILYLYIRIKKHLPILKMAEELISNLGYGAPQSDTKHQKLLECILTGIASCIWAKFTQQNSSPNLAKKK